MAHGSQYGEDVILADFFRDQPTGFVVDVGAADGLDNSNSFRLLERQGWNGILIEPDPAQFIELKKRYIGRWGVDCVDCAVGSVPGKALFHRCHQVSTLEPSWRERCEKTYGVKYDEIQVNVRTLTDILDSWRAPSLIDFMTVDVEGREMDVLKSMDFTRYQPRLLCLEGFGFYVPGYEAFTKTNGNTFYVPKKKGA